MCSVTVRIGFRFRCPYIIIQLALCDMQAMLLDCRLPYRIRPRTTNSPLPSSLLRTTIIPSPSHSIPIANIFTPLKFLPYHTTKTRKEKQPFVMKIPNLPSQACYAPTPPASSIAVYRKNTTSPYSAYEHFPLAKCTENSSIMTKHPDACFQMRRTPLHSQKYRCTAWRSFFFLLRYKCPIIYQWASPALARTAISCSWSNGCAIWTVCTTGWSTWFYLLDFGLRFCK